jgi:hypothetical protein
MTPSKTIEPLRADLAPLPDRIAALPVHRGYPVPWFVAYPDGPEGEPEFRTADYPKWTRAVKEKLCWVCGQQLGSKIAFVLGPMCGITRTTSEPACHRECAEWSIHNCPFLVRPRMTRRQDNLPEGTQDAAGCPLHRNPGVTLLWMAKTFTLFRDQNRRPLIRVGNPFEVGWFMEGRRATRQEVDESVAGGLPSLIDLAKSEGPAAEAALVEYVARFEFLLPAK